MNWKSSLTEKNNRLFPLRLFSVPEISLVIISVMLFTLAGCASLNMGHYPDEEARRISAAIEHVRNRNKGIETCKGSGWITLQEGGKSTRFRMAWNAVFPDKIRMTLLSSGHPVETIIADGSKVSFVSHTGKHPLHTIHSKNPSLKRVVAIPVTIKDIIAVFAGQIPLREHGTVERVDITYGAGGSSAKKLVTDTMLILKKQGKSVEKIVLNHRGNVLSYSLPGKSRRTGYTVLHEKMKPFDGYLLPVKVKINDHGEKKRSIEFKITGYQPNISIDPEVFVLTESR